MYTFIDLAFNETITLYAADVAGIFTAVNAKTEVKK